MLDGLFEGFTLKQISDEDILKKEYEFLTLKIGLDNNEVGELMSMGNKQKVVGVLMRAYKIGYTDGMYNK